MANMNWSKMDVDTQNPHVHHLRHPPHWKVSHFWHGQNVPKTLAYQPPRTQRNRAKPPGLLRLNSVGEAVEESSHLCPNRRQFCAASTRARPPKQSNPQQHNSYFLGNFWNKVREPLRTRQNLARTIRSPQEDIDLDHLVEKFALNSVNCEMDPQKFQPNMGQQEIDQRPTSTVVPVMTFNGGPYIKCASKDNTSPRTFPAYYRFLNLAHFHPYNNATRNRTQAGPPFQQHLPFRTGAWSGIAQRQPLSNKEACHHRPINQGAFLFTSTNHVKKNGNGRMMQKNCTMSHQNHQYSARATKPTSSPHETETKGEFCNSKQKLKTTQSNAAFVNNGTLLHLSKESSKDLEVESPLCEQTCVSLSQNRLSETDTRTNSISNTSQDKSPNQQGHVDSSQRNIACEESDCLCSSEETAKNFELKIVKCNNESDSQQPQKEVDSKEQTVIAAKPIEVANKKQMHSSIAFLLGDYMNSTPTCSNDSEFSDVDEEDLEDNKRELLDSFLPADNPLYVWKCLSKSEDLSNSSESEIENNTDKTLTFNDSGTVLGQTSDEATSSNSLSDESDVADSDSDPSDESSDSGCDEEEGMSDLQNPHDPMDGWHLQPSSSLKVSKGTSTESLEKGSALHSETKEAAALKLCPQRHPSVSFILGFDSSDGDTSDVSDAEDSSDFENASADYDQLWQSFELPRDPYNPINGCKFQTPSSIRQSALSPAKLASPKSSHPDLETDAGQQTPQCPSSDSLKQSSGTGCLKKAINPDKERVKKVSFCSKVPAIISPEITIWEDEYVEARRGQWEEFARDRCRFQRRIRQAEFIITPCLRPEHRVKVFLKLDS